MCVCACVCPYPTQTGGRGVYAYPIYREKTASSSRKIHIGGSCDKGLCPLPQPCDSVGRHVVELRL